MTLQEFNQLLVGNSEKKKKLDNLNFHRKLLLGQCDILLKDGKINYQNLLKFSTFKCRRTLIFSFPSQSLIFSFPKLKQCLVKLKTRQILGCVIRHRAKVITMRSQPLDFVDFKSMVQIFLSFFFIFLFFSYFS